jgi:hypothetical protein
MSMYYIRGTSLGVPKGASHGKKPELVARVKEHLAKQGIKFTVKEEGDAVMFFGDEAISPMVVVEPQA